MVQSTPPDSSHNDGQPSSTPTPTSTQSLPAPSPDITIQQVVDMPARPSLAPHLSAPPAAPHFQSPLRHHRRTPSQHREIKETLNARTEYTNDETDGRSQQTINQYVIREEIGRGSYGAVHLATDQFGKEYAIKEFSKMRLRKRVQSNILRRPGGGRPQFNPGRSSWAAHKKQLSQYEIAESKDALYLIREEIAIMKKLDHPNLVSLIEVLDDPEEDSLYMVLEMCKKGVVMHVGLDEQAKPLDEEHCWTWFRDLILGIEYLHHQGIVHRDIKPDNLLLTEEDVLKIVDFGVSEMFEKPDQMLTSKSAGSPAFLPPELCQAKHGDVSGKAADIWSMGVCLYCFKYGKLPFNGDNVVEMFEAIRTQEIPLPEGEDEDFVHLITRILDKNSETRITLPEIRNHPWVTKRGSDPLLSEEENCTDIVEPPNELEVSHAFTRKMDHLLCVLRAIHKFKSLTSRSRVTTPRTPRNLELPRTLELPKKEVISEAPELPIASNLLSEDHSVSRHKSNAEEAAELIKQRKAFLASSEHLTRYSKPSSEVGGKEHAQDSPERAPLLLGIGAGGSDNSTEAPSATVSDSPTGIDFDVYNRAFETEIKRIRSDRKKSRTRTYMTRLLGEKEVDKYAGDECMVIETGKSLISNVYTHGSSAVSRGLDQGCEWRETFDTKRKESHEGAKKAVDTAKEKTNKFADLVVSMTRDLKEKSPS
ncbi:kinase-like domain-containing protein [Biscogniauxia mediterranea]|nr:kinase-like domain-containing protein [Biscogniauxia mediterranea]